MKAVTALALAGVLAQVLPGSGVPAGNRAYRQGDTREAVRRYEQALARGDTSARTRYNLGTALLRAGRHDQGREHLEAASRGAGAVRPRAHYNAGNADLVPVARNSVPAAERRQRLERAIARYQRALLANPADRDAKWNLELARRLLQREGGESQDKDENQGGGGGGGAPQRPQQAAPQPRPDPDPQQSGNQPMSRQQAERILNAAEEDERQVQRDVMRRNQGTPRAVRDW